ncbi:hypothetical protein [Ureibacillus thermophilus]|uniref:Uncharacterized protein n=1 Tax=Ureibacillus thermophilus TaxID=367743 RepID=A0A4P6UTW4_9BACL|nr:hypothetical protein [Ureibacillus thermophilus]QBK25975.1 hypothetical protein DKZ56_08950 [Ureibacillus thermophilus]
MKRKTLFYVLTLVIAMILLAACGSSSDDSSSGSDSNNAGSEEKTYTFKLGHEAKEGHVKYATAEKFKEELEARSNLLNDIQYNYGYPLSMSSAFIH